MRKAKALSHISAVPRMSWSPHNLYNLLARSVNFSLKLDTDFTSTSLKMYQQRWKAKRLIRGYHGDHVAENRFKRQFLPSDLPNYKPGPLDTPRAGGVGKGIAMHKGADGVTLGNKETNLPIASLFVRDVERRLDSIVFRCCFARSVYESRALVVQGKVLLNGIKMTDPNRLLNPGDLVTVDAKSIYMLSAEAQKIAKLKKASKQGIQESPVEAAEEGEVETAAEAAKAGEHAEEASTEADAATAEPGSSATDGATTPTETSNTSAKEDESKPQSAYAAKKAQRDGTAPLPEGVLPFNLPPFAAPMLFVPPYLEVSFATCSAIYIRHPTLTLTRTSVRDPNATATGIASRTAPLVPRFEVTSDLPSPYPPSSQLFSLAWEHYARDAPRVRSDLRRLKLRAKVGRGDDDGGFERARAKDEWTKVSAQRRGWLKGSVGTRVPFAGTIASQATRLSSITAQEVERKRGVRLRLMKKKKL